VTCLNFVEFSHLTSCIHVRKTTCFYIYKLFGVIKDHANLFAAPLLVFSFFKYTTMLDFSIAGP